MFTILHVYVDSAKRGTLFVIQLIIPFPPRSRLFAGSMRSQCSSSPWSRGCGNPEAHRCELWRTSHRSDSAYNLMRSGPCISEHTSPNKPWTSCTPSSQILVYSSRCNMAPLSGRVRSSGSQRPTCNCQPYSHNLRPHKCISYSCTISLRRHVQSLPKPR